METPITTSTEHVYYESLEGGIVALREKFAERIANSLNIVELNEKVIELVINEANGLVEQLNNSQRQTLKNKISVLTSLSKNEEIQTQKSIIREQVIVLLIGALENYLGDVLRFIGNEIPYIFNFNDPNEKITFSQSMLSDGFKLGDAILDHIFNKGYSFQDLQSSIRVLKHYLGVDIILDESSKNDLILASALRNIIVHKSSRVDRRFLNQITETKYAVKYLIGDTIEVSQNNIEATVSALEAYADQVTGAIIDSES